MALTLDEMKTELRTAMVGRTDQNSRLALAMNIAQDQLARAYDFSELRVVESYVIPYTGTVATDRFILFSNLTNSEPRKIHSWRTVPGDGTGRKIIGRNQRWMDLHVPDPEFNTVGHPRVYLKWEKKFEIWPVNEQTYASELRISKWPTAFSDGSGSSTANHLRKDDILIFLALSYLYHTLGEYERAKMFFGMAQTQLEKAIGEDIAEADREIDTGANLAKNLTSYWADPFIRSAL